MRNISLFLLVFAFSCEKGSVNDERIWVYRTNHDYSKNVCVQLSPDKSKIVGFPAPNTRIKWPLKLADGYLLNGTSGVNSGFTSLKMDDYSTSVGADSLYKLLIDKDPFIDFYECTNNTLYTDIGVDTAKINQIIRNNELDMYFRKLK